MRSERHDEIDDNRCPRCGRVTSVFDLAAASDITCPRCDPAHRVRRTGATFEPTRRGEQVAHGVDV